MRPSNNKLIRIDERPRAGANARQRGFSLIEVLIVMTIAAILLGIGVPNLQAYLASNRIVSAQQELYTALQYARSEAMRRGQQITIRHNGAAGSRDWSGGWTMFEDRFQGVLAPNGALDAGEEVVRVGNAQPAPMTLYGSAAFADVIAFDAGGRLTSGGGTFVVCYGSNLVDNGQSRSRAVLINNAGRVRPAQDSNKDGIPEKDTGPVASCTNP